MELFGRERTEITSYIKQFGEPAFRAKQVANWLYAKAVRDISAMTNLPASLRELLLIDSTITRSKVLSHIESADGATKYLLQLADGETIESVLLPYQDRLSVCVSTQIGCAAGCVFCATADCGLTRNLTAGEIVDQVLTLQEQAGSRVTHVVFMGMGEPLLNLETLLKAIRLLHEEVGISMRRLTISTVGITPAIRRLQELALPLTLAISLHAPVDQLRQELIPVATKYPLNELMASCREYANTTKRRITFEYLLLAGINDSPEQATQLASLINGMLCHVNLIPYNEVPDKPFKRPSRSAITKFKSQLEHCGIEVTQRLERGHAVAAACGQLRARSEDVDK